MKKLEVGAKVCVMETIPSRGWSMIGEVVQIEAGRIVVYGHMFHWTKCPKSPPTDWPYEIQTRGWWFWREEVWVPKPWAPRKEFPPVTVVVPDSAFIFIIL